MQYSSYKAISERLFELETLTNYYGPFQRYPYEQGIGTIINSSTTADKAEQAIFDIVRLLPTQLPTLITEVHINSIENAVKCEKYINSVIELLSRHTTVAKLRLYTAGNGAITKLEPAQAFRGEEAVLIFSEIIKLERPNYKQICVMRWAAAEYMLSSFQNECESRLPSSYYDELATTKLAGAFSDDQDLVGNNTINEKLVFIKATGIYDLLMKICSNKKNAARAIGYLIEEKPNTIAPILTKIQYAKLPQTNDQTALDAAKKNNPYTKPAILKVFDLLLRLGIEPDQDMLTAFNEATGHKVGP
jgi:hypothetical protein